MEADLKEVQRCFHAAASKPDHPPAPSILKVVLCMSWVSILSRDGVLRQECLGSQLFLRCIGLFFKKWYRRDER